MTMTMSVEMPDSFSIELRSLLTGLLQRDVHKRLGCRGRGADEIKSHPFFRGIDWRVVFLQRLTPPLIPARGEVNAADAFDIGSFDDEDTKHIKLTDADQELYRNFPVVVSERWQHEIAETIFDYINHEADKAEMKRKNKHKSGSGALGHYQENEEQSDCILHGYIKRLGGTFTATWLTRYVRLYPNRLELWSDSGKQPELIFMDQMEEVCNDYVQIKNEQCIVIKLYNHSKYVFTNSDEIGLKEWHVSLKAAHKESLDMMTTMAEKATKIYGTEIPLKHMGKRRQQLQQEANNNAASAIASQLEQKIIQKELQASSSTTTSTCVEHTSGKQVATIGAASGGEQHVAVAVATREQQQQHKHHRAHHQHRSHHHHRHHHAAKQVAGSTGATSGSANLHHQHHHHSSGGSHRVVRQQVSSSAAHVSRRPQQVAAPASSALTSHQRHQQVNVDQPVLATAIEQQVRHIEPAAHQQQQQQQQPEAVQSQPQVVEQMDSTKLEALSEQSLPSAATADAEDLKTAANAAKTEASQVPVEQSETLPASEVVAKGAATKTINSSNSLSSGSSSSSDSCSSSEASCEDAVSEPPVAAQPPAAADSSAAAAEDPEASTAAKLQVASDIQAADTSNESPAVITSAAAAAATSAAITTTSERIKLAVSLENVSEQQEVLRDPSKRITSDNKEREQDLVAQYEKLHVTARHSSSSIDNDAHPTPPAGSTDT